MGAKFEADGKGPNSNRGGYFSGLLSGMPKKGNLLAHASRFLKFLKVSVLERRQIFFGRGFALISNFVRDLAKLSSNFGYLVGGGFRR